MYSAYISTQTHISSVFLYSVLFFSQLQVPQRVTDNRQHAANPEGDLSLQGCMPYALLSLTCYLLLSVTFGCACSLSFFLSCSLSLSLAFFTLSIAHSLSLSTMFALLALFSCSLTVLLSHSTELVCSSSPLIVLTLALLFALSLRIMQVVIKQAYLIWLGRISYLSSTAFPEMQINSNLILIHTPAVSYCRLATVTMIIVQAEIYVFRKGHDWLSQGTTHV